MESSIIEYNKSLTIIKSESDLPPHVSFEQYKALRNHPEIKTQADRMLITLLWETGGRVSDVLSFRWKNFEGLNSMEPNLRFVIKKTQKPINIPISPELSTDLRQWKQAVNPDIDERFLFQGKLNKNLCGISMGHSHETRQNVHKKMKVWGKLIGMPSLHAHLFRHGLIVYLYLVCGLHYKIIAARTGHSNPMMIINTYSVVTNHIQREALKNIPLR